MGYVITTVGRFTYCYCCTLISFKRLKIVFISKICTIFFFLSGGTDESLPPGTPLAVQCGAPTIPVHVPAQLYNSQSQHLPASHKAPAYTLNNHHLLQTVPPLQNGMVHSTPKALSSGGGEVVREQPSSKETTLQKSADVKKKKSSQFSIASFLDLSHSGKHVDAQSFAQEFHKSVLRTTQKSLANQKVGKSLLPPKAVAASL